jgi:ParB family chromosome partitioning protein
MFNTEAVPVAASQFKAISIGQLEESPTNPRKTFSEQGPRELADSITALGRLVQPIIVRPIDVDRYEVVAGARRFRAAKLANMHELVAHVMDLTDEQVIEVQLIENASAKMCIHTRSSSIQNAALSAWL